MKAPPSDSSSNSLREHAEAMKALAVGMSAFATTAASAAASIQACARIMDRETSKAE